MVVVVDRISTLLFEENAFTVERKDRRLVSVVVSINGNIKEGIILWINIWIERKVSYGRIDRKNNEGLTVVVLLLLPVVDEDEDDDEDNGTAASNLRKSN